MTVCVVNDVDNGACDILWRRDVGIMGGNLAAHEMGAIVVTGCILLNSCEVLRS